MKKAYLTIITLITVLAIILGSIYHFGIFTMHAIQWLPNILELGLNDDSEDDKKVTGDYDLDAFTKISVDAQVMNLTIQPGDQYHLNYTCSKQKLTPGDHIENGTLSLTQNGFSNPVKLGLRNNNKCKVTLTIPSDASLENIEIDTSVGGICLNDLTSDKLTVDTSVGDIEIKNCSIDNVSIDASTGDITLTNLHTNSTTLDCSVGDIDVTDCEFNQLTADCSTGDIEIDSSMDLSDHTMDLSTSLGDVEVNGQNHKKEYSTSGKSGRLELSTSVGDITVEYK